MSAPHGTIVLITGANQGLGYLAALQLSKLPGYTVLIGARSPEKGANAVERILADTEGGHAQSAVETILVNQDEDETLYVAVKQIEAKFSKLDVLVNNAAAFLDYVNWLGLPVNKDAKPMATRQLFENTYRTNVFGVAVLTEVALPLLEKSEFPRIVNVSSGLGSHGNMTDPSASAYHARAVAYSTSKSAINGLTVHFAYVLGQKNANSRVISVDPGYNATNMNDGAGTQDPSIGAAGILRYVTVGPGEHGYKTGEYRDQFGEVVPW